MSIFMQHAKEHHQEISSEKIGPISDRHNYKVALLVYLIFSTNIRLAWPGGKLSWLRNAYTTYRGWIISITFRVLEDQIWHYLVPPTTKMVWLIVGFFTCVNKRFSQHLKKEKILPCDIPLYSKWRNRGLGNLRDPAHACWSLGINF